MAKRYSRKARKSRRGKRGGAMTPLSAGAYPAAVSGTTSWNTSVTPGTEAAAAGSWKSLLEQVAGNTGGEGANPAAAQQAMNKYALTGPGPQSAPPSYSGGAKGYRHRLNQKTRGKTSAYHARTVHHGNHHGHHAQQKHMQFGGMLTTFGAMVKEALVPLGLLALNQTVGKKTRKHRK